MKEEEIEFFETRIPILKRHYALVSEFNGQINEEETKKLFIYIRQLQKDNRKLKEENKSLQSQLKAKEEEIKEIMDWLKYKAEQLDTFDIPKRKETGAFWFATRGEIETILSKGENK